MKITKNKLSELNLENLKIKNNESHKSFADRWVQYYSRYISKDIVINLDKLSNQYDSVQLLHILRSLSFKYEKLTYQKGTSKFEINLSTKNHKKYEAHVKVMNALKWVRELQDLPQNILTPKKYKEILHKEFKSWFVIPEDKYLKKMNLFSGVGNSSNNKQEFVVLSNKKNPKNPIVIIGKGVTYDSGGYNLKVGKNLLGMKADMSGSAIMAGVMKLVKEFNINKEIVCLLPLAENLLSNKALMPQNIIKSLDQTFVEIKNTDAEGRLILADSISYAKLKYKPKLIIEASTLTGQISTILSNLASGIFTNTPKVINEFMKISKITGERFHYFERFPEVTHRLYNSSSIADIANVDLDVKMGSLYAFEFLNHFAGSTPFIHLDVAGTSVLSRDRGTAESMHTIFEYVNNFKETYKK